MQKTILTCSVTGNQTTVAMNPNLPVTPEQIASSALDAAAAGAAAVHIHVRHPDGSSSMELAHYKEVVDRIRAVDTALIINLTTGPGGRYHPSDADPAVAGERTNLLLPQRRVEHVVALRPDVCTLDLNTMVFGREVVINTPASVRAMAAAIYDCGTVPELEMFDSGDLALAAQLISDGALRVPAIASLVLGTRFGFVADGETMMYARSRLPRDVTWTGFGVGKSAFPMIAQSYILGGHIRIGMEDTVYAGRGKLTSGNGELCDKAKWLVTQLGGELATAEEARVAFGLRS